MCEDSPYAVRIVADDRKISVGHNNKVKDPWDTLCLIQWQKVPCLEPSLAELTLVSVVGHRNSPVEKEKVAVVVNRAAAFEYLKSSRMDLQYLLEKYGP